MRILIALAVSILMIGAANANWYLKAGGGASFADETGFNDTIEKDLPYGFKPFEFDLRNGRDTGYLVEFGLGRSFNNVLGGTMMVGVATNYRGGFDSSPGIDYLDSITVYEDVEKTLGINGGFESDLSSLGFMLDLMYRFDQVSASIGTAKIAPLANIQIGAARNKLSNVSFNATATKTFGRYDPRSVSVNCGAEDTTNVDLAYALRAGADVQFSESMSLQILGGYFNQGMFKSPENFACGASHGEETENFDKTVAGRENSLDGWDVMAALVYKFGTP